MNFFVIMKFLVEMKYNFKIGGEEFVPQGKSVRTFWRVHKDMFPILSQLAESLVSVVASSSIIEREFSKVSAVVTKVRNRMSARSILHFLQLKEYEDFAEGVAEKFNELGIPFDKNENEFIDVFDSDYAEACFDEEYQGELF